MGTFFSFFNGDHRHAFFQKPSSAFGVVLISGVEKMLHYIKFIPGSQDQIGFFCGKGEIEAGFLNGVPGILPVIQIKGYCHMIAPCQRDGVNTASRAGEWERDVPEIRSSLWLAR